MAHENDHAHEGDKAQAAMAAMEQIKQKFGDGPS
jgi:hypothetical protein